MEWTERELREQTEWMRRVARALTGNADQADDLTQDAWVATLDGRARVHSPRAWFRKLLQNKRSSAQRSQGRRADRERVAARPEAIPPVDEAAQRVELQAKLAKAVFSLEEPYRQAITLRYLQGWPPRRIASDLHLNPRQVEVRLRQGLEKLRMKLDAANDGRREDWFGAMVAIGGTGFPLAKTAAVICVSALAVGATVLLPRMLPLKTTRPQAPDGLETTALLEAPSLLDRITPKRSSSPRKSLVTPRVLAPSTHTITFVREGDDAPLPNLSVEIDGESFQTDEHGALVVTWPAPPLNLNMQVAATKSTRSSLIVLSSGRPSDRTVAMTRRGGTLRVQVLTMDGDPVPQAEVRFFKETGTGSSLPWSKPARLIRSDAHGKFEADDLSGPTGHSETYDLVASAPGWLSPYRIRGRISSKSNEFTVLHVDPAHTVHGHVSSSVEASVARAPMIYYSKNSKARQKARRLLSKRSKTEEKVWGKPYKYPSFEVHADASGNFTFQRNEAPCHLQVDHPDYMQWRGWLTGEGFHEIVLETGCALAGRVLSASGTPIAGASVRLRAHERRAPLETDAKGEFTFRALTPLEGAILAIHAPGHALAVFDVHLAPGISRDFHLEEEHIVRGRLVDSSGAPVSNAQVQLRGDRFVGSSWMPRHRGISWERWTRISSSVCATGPEGRFEFRRLYPGSYRVRIGEETWAAVPTNEEEYVVVMGKDAGSTHLRGSIRSEGGPLSGPFHVTLHHFLDGESEPTTGPIVLTAETDEFEAKALDPGTWQVEVVHAPSQWSWKSPQEYLASGTHAFDVVLRPRKD